MAKNTVTIDIQGRLYTLSWKEFIRLMVQRDIKTEPIKILQ